MYLSRGWGHWQDEWDKASWRKPYRPLALDPAHGQFYPQPPSNKLHCGGRCPATTNTAPEKRDVVHKGYAILNIAMKQLWIEREVNTKKARRNTWVRSPWASFLVRASTPPPSSQVHAQSISNCSLVEALASSGLFSLDNSSAYKTSSNV